MDHTVIKPVSAYLTGYASKPQARQALLDFTEAHPNHQPVVPLIPMEEYTTRLDLIREIRNHQMRMEPEFDITRLQFCYLIRMTVSDLHRVVEQCRYDPYQVKVYFESFVDLTDYYLNQEEVSNTASRSSVVSDTTKVRNDNQKDLCLALDKCVCIVTEASHPNVCHIIPCSSAHHRAFIKSLRPILSQYLGLPQGHTTHMMLDSLIEPGSSDHVWNMICLSPTLHDWWGRGYFGLKFLGATLQDNSSLSTVELQLVWMPRFIEKSGLDGACKPISLVAQRNERTTLSSNLTHFYGGHTQSCHTPNCTACSKTNCANAHNVHTHKPVLTGSVFKIYRPTTDVPNFQRAIQIQWAIICAAALSGRAQDIEAEKTQRIGLDTADILEWMEKSV